MSTDHSKPAAASPPLHGARPAGLGIETAEVGPPLPYRPVWNVQQKVIGIYRCERPAPCHGGDRGETDQVRNCRPAALGSVDGAVLARVLSDLEPARRGRGMASICLPVHHATLTDTATRNGFVALCDRIPAELRGLLVWEISGMPENAGERALFSMVSTVKPFGRAIFVRCGRDQPDFDTAAAVGVHSVGLDLGAATEPEAPVISRLDRFAHDAHEAGLRCHVYGISTSSISLAAVAAGFDYLAGDTIGKAVAAPLAVRPFDTENIFLSGRQSAG